MFSRFSALNIGFAVLLLGLLPEPASPQADDLRQSIVDNHLRFLPGGDGPFPTLIAIPGCSGIAFEDPEQEATHPELAEDDRLFRGHYLEMSRRLSEVGFAVVLIHIHRAEGLVTACGGEIDGERIAAYINESVAWVQELDFVDSSRIHVVGWSMGGGGALAWLHGPRTETEAVESVVAIYPSCRDRERISAPVPLLMLLGGADDIARPSVCEDLVALSGKGTRITVERYPEARHGFDIEAAPPVLDIGNGMTVGYRKAAAEASWHRILQFLSDGM